MKKLVTFCLCLAVCSVLFLAGSAFAQQKNVRVNIVTSEGNIVLELWPDKAPATVENFLKYAKAGFYEGTTFHRVISNFMIQGGGFDENLKPKRGMFEPIVNEADNGEKNRPYTIAMARTGHPHSATNEFFINVQDNKSLNFKSKSMEGYGYCVFGEVYAGKNVVDKIRDTPVKAKGPMPFAHVPVKPVVIKRVEVLP